MSTVCVCVWGGVACQEGQPKPSKIHGHRCFSAEGSFAPRGRVTMSGDAFFFLLQMAATGMQWV